MTRRIVVSGRKDTATRAVGANQSNVKRGRRLPYCLLLLAFVLGAAFLQNNAGKGFPASKTRSNSQWAHLYASLPLSFEMNRGQTDSKVNYLARGQGYTLFLTGQEAVLSIRNSRAERAGQQSRTPAEALRLQLLGANSHPIVSGADPLPGKANYFIGNDPAKWYTDIPTYARVKYTSVYPGVDLVYYGDKSGKLEYDFVVAPGADASAIALGVAAQNRTPLHITPEGDLVVNLREGEATFHQPVVYQEKSRGRNSNDEIREPVEGHYLLDSQNHVRFELGPYDHSRSLVIDPVLIYGTYIGGSGGDTGFAIAVNSSGTIPGEAYIAGLTNSSNFPTTGGAASVTYGGDGDCFLSEMNNTGTTLIFSSYLGGSGSDACTALSLSSAGTLFVTGYTSSTNFPTKVPAGIGTTIPYQQANAGGTDAFVAEFTATGNSLVYSTYLGGSGLDQGMGIASDTAGNAYVTGFTQSSNFPVLAGAYQASLEGSQNVFIAKMNPDGTALLYSTFLGGSLADAAQTIQIDGASPPNMYIAGYTFSSNFPTASPIQASLKGVENAFVAELNGAGTALTFSTFLGGAENDEANGLALDGSDNIYVVGSTTSSNFPTTSGAFQTALAGPENAFVTKLNSGGTSLGYSTFLGGSVNDQGMGIAVTPAGNAFVTGLTESSNFPTLNPVQAILGGSSTSLQDCGTAPCPDAFITQFNSTGSALVYSTYLGGSGYDSGQAIVLDDTGDPYITGTTVSTNFPVATPNANVYTPPYKTTLTGTAGNAYFAKIDVANNPQISIQPGTVNFGSQSINIASTVQNVYLVNPSTAPLVITNILVVPVNNSTTVYQINEPATGGCLGTLPPNGASCYFGVTFTPNATGTQSTLVYITDNAGGTVGVQQTVSLTGVGTTAATSATIQPSSLSFTSQAVGTQSAAQTVTITNNGVLPLAISSFSVGSSLDFTVLNPPTTGTTATTPGCLYVNNTLAAAGTPGGITSCFVYVYFNPTASGTRNATLSITDNATGSPQGVALTGMGVAAFTLSSPSAELTLIGNTTTTFVIEANAPPGSFNGTIALSCSANTTCSFNPPTIFANGGTGSTSTMTVSNLTSTTPNPYPFVVTGTSGSQSYPLNMTINFEDYMLTITPPSYTVQAGGTATYTVFVNPLFGFNNQAVTLTCYAFSPVIEDTTCQFLPTAKPVTSGISPAQVQLSITTAHYTPPVQAPPFFPKGKLPPILFGLLTLAGLASLALGNRRRARAGGWGTAWFGVRLAALSLILALDLALAASCRSSTLTTAGTVTGNYLVTIQGELDSNNTVNRYAYTDLSVTTTIGTPTTPSPAP